jgi:DNA polymerase
VDHPDSVEERIAALARAASTCTACPLHASRTQVVFGDGNPASPLVIVGEGPGETEDQLGRPFVGRAGQFLDQCLRACGITRKHVYITNVVRCRPTRLENGRLWNRAPAPDEVESCSRLWLHPTLETIAPLVLLCLGGPSASTLIRPGFRITSERGQFVETRWARATIASLHPAYILRKTGSEFDNARQLLIDDIEAARRKVVELRKTPQPPTLL